ncbi:helix-turn-helix domain-containing protein [Paractinoplanes abujensis]|uniref:Transcriptional regulator with XRE-family HTH domain n=1 Tax=Paractinoplanes abujensis TaxID=882441 RepID=A0A7W7CUW0_9ACTN|nr:helix-turn-helix transcriptional regulator [Actinoplanes abujensis]MBB4693905.1 transcriptional regulator with XRE-family HTH domain [Actinoplanes abujensis]
MNELGAVLRAWRDRRGPEGHDPARRVPGLRREELATLAGISIEYVVRLEQGRAPTPSAQVCSSLARALNLSGDEHAHLLRLAGHAADPARVPREIPDSLHRIMDQLGTNPLAVYDATWQLLHWNELFAATCGDPAETGLNALLCHFEGRWPWLRQSEAERAAFEESMVADLRATTSRYPDDPAVSGLVERLRASARFRELWALRSVADHRSAHKTIEHPVVGDIALDTDVLATQGSNLRLVVYTPRPGTDAREKLDRLIRASSR